MSYYGKEVHPEIKTLGDTFRQEGYSGFAAKLALKMLAKREPFGKILDYTQLSSEKIEQLYHQQQTVFEARETFATQVALSMLLDNQPIELIVKYTKLSYERIEQLRHEQHKSTTTSEQDDVIHF